MALKTAALSNIDVRIILPVKADHRIVHLGSRSYFSELLNAGIKIYEYNTGFFHAKVLLVDDEFVSVGSANMDLRSFKDNFEINSVIYDKNFSKKIKCTFENDFQNSILIIQEEFEERPLIKKYLESASRMLSPLL